MMFFTADEHYGHWSSPQRNIILYANRPFQTIEEMNEALISNHNSVVSKDDLVIHAGDFALCIREKAQEIVKRLNGKHAFLMGDHDRWLGNTKKWDIRYYKTKPHQIIVCHFCLRVWPRSHYNSWHLYGHSHGRLEPIGKSHDIGVDNNNFFPLSEEEIVKIMNGRPDNPNLVKKR